MEPRALAFTLAIFALARAADGWWCLPSTFAQDFHAAAARGAPISLARIVGNYTESGDRSPVNYQGYILRVERVYSDCAPATPYFAIATHAVGSFGGLEFDKPYLLPLNKDRTVTDIEGCGIVTQPQWLSKDQRAFLDSRQLCCNGLCKCAAPPTNALAFRRCRLEKPPCAGAAVCRDNYCSGAPEWFTATGMPACPPPSFGYEASPGPEGLSPSPELILA